MNVFGLIATSRRSLPRVLPLFRDDRVPRWLKIATGVTAVAIISPLNLLSDIPVIGLFDDLTLLTLLANGFVRVGKRYTSEVDAVNVTPAPTGTGAVAPALRA